MLCLEFLDDPMSRVGVFGQLYRGVRQVAAAIVRRDHFGGELDPFFQLCTTVLGMARFDVGQVNTGLPDSGAETFYDQVSLRIEMTVQRHFVRAGRFGDGVDTNTAIPL